MLQKITFMHGHIFVVLTGWLWPPPAGPALLRLDLLLAGLLVPQLEVGGHPVGAARAQGVARIPSRVRVRGGPALREDGADAAGRAGDPAIGKKKARVRLVRGSVLGSGVGNVFFKQSLGGASWKIVPIVAAVGSDSVRAP